MNLKDNPQSWVSQGLKPLIPHVVWTSVLPLSRDGLSVCDTLRTARIRKISELWSLTLMDSQTKGENRQITMTVMIKMAWSVL